MDIRVTGNQISETGKNLSPDSQEELIDLSGKILTTGFVIYDLTRSTFFRKPCQNLPILTPTRLESGVRAATVGQGLWDFTQCLMLRTRLMTISIQ